MREKSERGAVVVEAIISMTCFLFTILIILSIADIAYTQSKMAVALNSAAKEISQYCFLYYKFQLDDANASLSNGTQDAEKSVNNTVDGLGQMMDSFGEAGNSFEEGKFDNVIDNLKSGTNAANETVSNLADQIADDPKAFVIGMGKLAGREMTEGAKVFLGQVMAKAFMKKNLKASSEDDPDAFLKRLHVVDGMKGLDFQYSSLMAYGSSSEIYLVCTYKVRVVQLLKVDFDFTFRQTAITQAWGAGNSIITPRSVWTGMAPMVRGKYIVGEEKEGYTFTSSGKGFDAYVNSSGKNEFVTITSMDLSSPSYQDAKAIKNHLNKCYNDMHDGVSSLGNSITMKKNKDKEVTVESDPATRTYQIVLVLPEETDKAYRDKVDQAVRELKAEHPGLSVKVKEGYGSIKTQEAEKEPEKE